jgi:ATP phosphoribosyltransferase regulatory subunit
MLRSAAPFAMAASTLPPDPTSAAPSLPAASARRRTQGALAHPLPAGMRDLLPEEAARQLAMSRDILQSFEKFGYEPVSVPPFEYAEVLEHDMGPLDPAHVLRFVEPETGEVVALRPDMTPQVARLVATRLADAPPPLRLCYEGSVVRRRVERARRERQIQQTGFELVGLPGPEGDVEVLTVAASAVRAAGLGTFTLDLGHAKIAGSLVESAAPEARAGIIAALSAKDGEETRRRAENGSVHGRELAALVELPSLYGGADVWPRADRLLAGTAAEGPARALRDLYDRISLLGLAPNLVVDLGETWSFAYYTGMLFQILAEGPGEPVGSGGRYDRLFDRFGSPRPSAGFAADLGNLGWALERAGVSSSRRLRVLLVAPHASPAMSDALLGELRRRGIPAALGPATGAEAYARAWRYTHRIEITEAMATLVDVESGESRQLRASAPRDVAAAAVNFLDPKHPETRPESKPSEDP